MRHAVYDHDDYVVYVAGQSDLHHRLLVRASEQGYVGTDLVRRVRRGAALSTGQAANLLCRPRMSIDRPVIACLYVRLLALYITGDYGWLGYTSVGFSGVRSSTLSVLIGRHAYFERQTELSMPAWSYMPVINQPLSRSS